MLSVTSITRGAKGQSCNHTFSVFLKDPLHNSGGTVVRGSGWAARRLFAANSPAIGKKNNAADRSSPRSHRPQGVMQRVLKGLRATKTVAASSYIV